MQFQFEGSAMAGSVKGRLVILAAARPGARPGALRTAAEDFVRDLEGRAGTLIGTARVLPLAPDNPLKDSGFTRDRDYELVLDVEVGLGSAPQTALLAALRGGLGDALDHERSIAVLGLAHTLRALDPDAYFGLYVAIVGHQGVPADAAHAGWWRVGRYNAVHHPACSGYAQIHADPELTSRVAQALRLTGQPHIGVAFEAFRSAAALADGQAYAARAVDGYGEPEDGSATLLDLLDRYLDFSTATSVMAGFTAPDD